MFFAQKVKNACRKQQLYYQNKQIAHRTICADGSRKNSLRTGPYIL